MSVPSTLFSFCFVYVCVSLCVCVYVCMNTCVLLLLCMRGGQSSLESLVSICLRQGLFDFSVASARLAREACARRQAFVKDLVIHWYSPHKPSSQPRATVASRLS